MGKIVEGNRWLKTAFSLRALFCAMTVMAIGVAIYARATRTRRLIENLERMGAIVICLDEPQFVDSGWPRRETLPCSQFSVELSKNWTGETLADLTSLAGLTTLIIEPDARLPVDWLVAITELPSLKDLAIRSPQCGDSCMRLLSTQVNLSDLSLDGSPVGDDGCVHLAALDNLSHLSLGGTRIGDNGCVHLAALDNLTSLSLEGTRVGDDGCIHLAALDKLTFLSLSHTSVTDDVLDELPISIECLYLSGTRISDHGLNKLARLMHLKSLNLMNTDISDDGLAAIATHPNLRRVALLDTRVTAIGVDKLRRAWSDRTPKILYSASHGGAKEPTK